MVQRPSNNVGEAGVGAGILGAGDRMPGIEMTPSGRAEASDHHGLDRADVGDGGAGLQMRSDLGGDNADGSRPGGTRSPDRRRRRRRRCCPRPDRRNPARRPARAPRRAGVATTSPTTPCARAAWTIDEPIRPQPINARRSYSGAVRLTLNSLSGWFCAPLSLASLSQKFFQRGDHEPVRFFGADTHSQRIRQLVAADLTQNESARGEERVGVLGGTSLRVREMDEQEIGDARGHLEPELFEFLRQPGEPAIVVLTRALLVCVSSIAAMPAAIAGPLTLNGREFG